MSDEILDSDEWIAILSKEEIPSDGARIFESPVGQIAIFKTQDDEIFAVLDACPHKGGPLSQGIVHGHTVTCPLHAWNIDLSNGNAVAPDQGCVKKFTTEILDQMIYFKRSELKTHA
jgi:nitrite reductase (NADH) small subunit